jgi:hypothetical protein
MDSELRKFARSLIRGVRDEAIDACDLLIEEAAETAPEAGVLRDPDVRSALTALAPEIVDEVLFQLLDRIDNEDLPLAWRRRDGVFMPLLDLGEGEMAGWLTAEDGWVQSFSRKPFTDPLKNIHPSSREDDEES